MKSPKKCRCVAVPLATLPVPVSPYRLPTVWRTSFRRWLPPGLPNGVGVPTISDRMQLWKTAKRKVTFNHFQQTQNHERKKLKVTFLFAVFHSCIRSLIVGTPTPFGNPG